MSENGRTTNEKRNGGGRARHNALSFHQQVRLLDLLRSRAERYQNERPAFEAVAAELSPEIGFKLTPANVATVAKAANVVWRPRVRRTSPGKGLSARVRVLERVVQELCSQLNMPLPAEWDQLTAKE